MWWLFVWDVTGQRWTLRRENYIDLSTIEITEVYNILQGTRSALYANDRESISVTVQEVTPRTVGALIALYERAVGIYASLVNINAYHQPGMLLKTKYCSSVFIKLFCCMYLFVDFVIYRCWGWEKGSWRSTGTSEKGADCIKWGRVCNLFLMFLLLFLYEVIRCRFA